MFNNKCTDKRNGASNMNAKIIKATLKSKYMQDVIARKGWSDEWARMMVVDFLTCGEEISVFDFMERAEAIA